MISQSVLIVDDERPVLDAMRREISTRKAPKGLTVHTALSVREALDVLDRNKGAVQVLVSDLRMADGGGDELIREVKRAYPDIRCILVSGHPDMRGISRAVSAGITAFIPKPWETASLLGEIDKALGQFSADTAEHERASRLAAQVASAAEIQKRLLGSGRFSHSSYNVEVAYQPSYRCGGDFYHVFSPSEDRCIIMIGRVAGQGPGAAFVSGIVRTLISGENPGKSSAEFSPSQFLRTLNTLILRELAAAPEFVITLTAAMLDCAAHRVVFSNAGSLPLYLVRPTECTTHVLPGFPCGFTPDAHYAELVIQARRGDKIAFLTDGLLEKGRVSRPVDLDAIRSLMMHFVRDPAFTSRVVGIMGEMFPENAFRDDVTLVTVDIL